MDEETQKLQGLEKELSNLEQKPAVPASVPVVPVAPAPTPGGKSKILWLAIGFFVLSLIIVGAYFLGQRGLFGQKPTATPTPISSPTPVSTTTPEPTELPTSTPASGWKTYTNDQYGFEISYPPAYKVLTDAKDLYGWPKAVALLYKGGQSYDLVIEVWDSQAEYQAKYQNALYPPVVKKLGDKYLTLLNQNNDAEVAAIIATFKP